jgi:hypothetical protein
LLYYHKTYIKTRYSCTWIGESTPRPKAAGDWAWHRMVSRDFLVSLAATIRHSYPSYCASLVVQPIVLHQHKLSLRADILTPRPYGLAKPRLQASPDHDPRLIYLNERRPLVSLSLNTIMWPFRSVPSGVICGIPLAFLSPPQWSAGGNLHGYDTIDHICGEIVLSTQQ